MYSDTECAMTNRKFHIFSFFLLITLSAVILNAQTIINDQTPLRYFIAGNEPPTDWMLSSFDDSDWIPDTGSIGYGYGDEDVPLPDTTKSVYVRYKFHLNTPEALKEMNISLDYDDGYILYLNGKELIRRNISMKEDLPGCEALTFRSHEREDNYNFPVYGYYFDSTVLYTCNIQYDNTIAVHIFNDTLQGSDLYGYLRVYKLSGVDYNMYSSTFRYKRQFMPDSTDLPLVIIETGEFGITRSDSRSEAFMRVVDNGKDKYNKVTDSSNVFYGDISIEVRGESSNEFCKKSYRFELWDSLQKDSNVVMLGMPADNDWILYGPFQDKAQFRNPMVFDLARNFGRYQPRTRYCEVILNGEDVGIYTLTETIKRADHRIDIAKLRQEEVSGIDVTGGYILKYDKPGGNLQIIYPKEDKIQPAQRDYIMNFMAQYRSTVLSKQFLNPLNGYRKYICDTSLVDLMIINELTKNGDGYKLSTYLYKDRADRDNRLIYGTQWDHDLSFGNTLFQEGNLTYGWQFEFDNFETKVTRMLQDTALVHLFQRRWHEARQSFLHTDSLFAWMDSTVDSLTQAIQRNYYIWPVIDKYLFNPNYIPQSYEEEIGFIKNWLTERLAWVDENIDYIYYEVDTVEPPPPNYNQPGGYEYFTFDVYPNPFCEELTIAFLSSGEPEIRIDIFDLNGQLRYSKEVVSSEGYTEFTINDYPIGQLPAGIYMLRISRNSEFSMVCRIVKTE